MIVTNSKALPEPIHMAIKYGDKYDGYGTLSVTTLIEPPKQWILKKKHADDIHVDVSEMMWAMFGSACHSFIEGAKLSDKSRYVIEKRMRYIVDDTTVSGKMDLLDLNGATFDPSTMIIRGGKIWDYKVSSVWSYIFRDEKDAWIKQLNFYATLLRNVGFVFTQEDVDNGDNIVLGHAVPANTPVRVYPSEASIVLIMRDWQRKKAEYEIDYPRSQVEEIPVNLYDDAELWAKFNARITYFLEVSKYVANGGDVHHTSLDCTDKDMWGTGQTYKVKSSMTAARAYPYGSFSTKDYPDAEDRAIAFQRQKAAAGQPAFIQLVNAEYRKCSSFCMVREFCQQRIRNNIPLL